MEFKKLIKTSAIISAIIGVTTVTFNSKNIDIINAMDSIYAKASGYLQTIKDKNAIIKDKDDLIAQLETKVSTLKEQVILISNLLGVNEGLNTDNFNMDNLSTYIANIVSKINSNGEASEEQLTSLKSIANALGVNVGDNATVSEITNAIIEKIGELQAEISSLKLEIEELEKQIEEYEAENGSLVEKIQQMERELNKANTEEEQQLAKLQQQITNLEALENEVNNPSDGDKGEGTTQGGNNPIVMHECTECGDMFTTEEELANHIDTEHKEEQVTETDEAYDNLSAKAKEVVNYYNNGGTVQATFSNNSWSIMDSDKDVYIMNITQNDYDSANAYLNK